MSPAMREIVEALGWALVHFVWQGLLIAAVLEVVVAAMRGLSPQARYLVRCAGLALMAIAPFITFAVVYGGDPAIELASLIAAAEIAVDATTPFSEQALPWVVLAWSVGAGLLSLRLAGGCLQAWRWRRRTAGDELEPRWQGRFDRIACDLGVRAMARVVDSAAVAVPMVVGWLKPVVLLPARVFTGLDEEQIEALLAHELAHVKRYDWLVNILQSAVEALLFYHPAVWWVSNGIRTEREYCCDDVAVAVARDGVSYARALTALETWRGGEVPAGVSTLGGSLMKRIQRLVGLEEAQRPRLAGAVHAIGALVVAGSLGATAFGLAAPPEEEAPDSAWSNGEMVPEVEAPNVAVASLLDVRAGELERDIAALKAKREARGWKPTHSMYQDTEKKLKQLREEVARLRAEVEKLRAEESADAEKKQKQDRVVVHENFAKHIEHAKKVQKEAEAALGAISEHVVRLQNHDVDTKKILEHVHKAIDAHEHDKRGATELHENIAKSIEHLHGLDVDLEGLHENIARATEHLHGIEIQDVSDHAKLLHEHLKELHVELPDVSKHVVDRLHSPEHTQLLHEHLKELNVELPKASKLLVERLQDPEHAKRLHEHLIKELNVELNVPQRLVERLHGPEHRVHEERLHQHLKELNVELPKASQLLIERLHDPERDEALHEHAKEWLHNAEQLNRLHEHQNQLEQHLKELKVKLPKAKDLRLDVVLRDRDVLKEHQKQLKQQLKQLQGELPKVTAELDLRRADVSREALHNLRELQADDDVDRQEWANTVRRLQRLNAVDRLRNVEIDESRLRNLEATVQRLQNIRTDREKCSPDRDALRRSLSVQRDKAVEAREQALRSLEEARDVRRNVIKDPDVTRRWLRNVAVPLPDSDRADLQQQIRDLQKKVKELSEGPCRCKECHPEPSKEKTKNKKKDVGVVTDLLLPQDAGVFADLLVPTEGGVVTDLLLPQDDGVFADLLVPTEGGVVTDLLLPVDESAPTAER